VRPSFESGMRWKSLRHCGPPLTSMEMMSIVPIDRPGETVAGNIAPLHSSQASRSRG